MEIKDLKPGIIYWKKTIEANRSIMKSNWFYDGTILKGQIDGQEIKVIRSSEDREDLEKAVMMGLLKSFGVSYTAVKKVIDKIQFKFIPKFNQTYFYITDTLEIAREQFDDYSYEKARIEIGNCFRSREEAEAKLKQLKSIIGGMKNV